MEHTEAVRVAKEEIKEQLIEERKAVSTSVEEMRKLHTAIFAVADPLMKQFAEVSKTLRGVNPTESEEAGVIGKMVDAWAPKVKKALADEAAKPAVGVMGRALIGLGLKKSLEPAKVSMSKAEALAGVATVARTIMPDVQDIGGKEGEVVVIATAGWLALGVEVAYSRGLVEQPKKGLSKWQMLGLGLGGAVVVGGAVTGGMYYAGVGPYAKKAAKKA